MNLLIIFVFLCFAGYCLPYDGYDSNDQFNWGLYKPQLIHAISQSQKNPLTISQAYFDNKDIIQTLRYKFPKRQSDKIIYNYRVNTGVGDFAIQDVFDPLLGDLEMSQTFIRLDSTDWIDTTKNITSRNFDNNQIEIGFIYSIAFENFDLVSKNSSQGRYLDVVNFENQKIVIKSSDNQHKIVIEGKNLKENISYRGTSTQEADNWKVDDILSNIKYSFNNQVDSNSTIIFVKMAVLMNAKSEIQLYYTPKTDKNLTYVDDQQIIELMNPSITKEFENIFKINSQFDWFSNEKQSNTIRQLLQKNKQSKTKYSQYDNEINESQMTCAQQSFSNLMGGIQYSYGNLLCVQDEQNCKEYLPLFSTTPSRLGFPRPFLWDDGFHQMISCQWDVEFCKQDIEKWFNTISPQDGWIPREQPRGEELRSYIPQLYEDNRDGNPPSFLFNLLYIKNLGNQHQSFINKLIPKLQLWFDWWMNIQSVKPDSNLDSDILLFKWWGPSDEVNLGSGMDDWPRVDTFENQTYISKYNVDASAWAFFFSQSLAELTNNSTYKKTAQQIKQSINKILLNNDDLIHYDFLEYKTSSDDGINITKYHLSTHIGYPNFLPLIVGLVEDKQVLEKQIHALMNNQTLWTSFGIRSLSLQDEYFGKGDNYWRGPIWINIQYLLLRSMKKYYWNVSPDVQNFYQQLRNNVISTVCGQFEERGYFFEHFNQNLDGQGCGNHPFNGWTSLITLIITESYV